MRGGKESLERIQKHTSLSNLYNKSMRNVLLSISYEQANRNLETFHNGLKLQGE